MKYTKEQFSEAVKTSNSIKQVADKLNIKSSSCYYKTFYNRCEKWNIDFSHFANNIKKRRGLSIDKDQFIKVVNKSTSYSEVANRLSIGYRRVKKLIKEWDIDTSHFEKQMRGAFSNKEKVIETIKSSISIAQTLKRLNIPVGAGNYKSFYKFCKQNNIDYSHFKGKLWNKNKKKRISKEDIEEIFKVNNCRPTTSEKRKIKESNLIKYQCAKCGLGPYYNGKKLTLQLDHINGNPHDNSKSNLRYLCPNCHSQTDTYCKSKLTQ